ALQRFRQLKPYTMLFVSTYIASTILIYIYEWLTTFLPESLQYSETQNQMELLSLFDNPWLLPLLFIDIVILTPFVEEMLFRHLLIHELGKKFTYTLMTIISIVVFGCLHMTGAQSPFEIGSYLILGGSIVFVYLITGKNLAAAVTFHMLNNLVAFILIVVTL
ncbi:CPBP family intramembrane glutamic endopeptidase, partial [Staphylococcus arlettae]